MLQEAKSKIEQGEVNEAMELMNRFGGIAVKNRLMDWLSEGMGPEDVVCRSEAEFSRHPVGTGPFQVTHMEDGICVLEAFVAHFRGRPQLDRVEVLILPDSEP